MNNPPLLKNFPGKTTDKLRYGDTDKQGHVNNAIFATFFETGRADLLITEGSGLWSNPDINWVLVRVEIDYLAETFWPGSVEIGTGIERIGTSSVTMAQAVFQNGRCVANGRSVVVQLNNATRRPLPFTPELRAAMEKFTISA